MKAIVSLTLVVLVLLAGCIGPLQAGANTGDAPSGPTISVSATGSANADPDLAVVNVAVETTADGANAARAQVARDIERVRGALADGGVADANVTTTTFGIAPVYNYSRGEREVVGYRAVHALAIETAPDRVGEIVDLAVGNGATHFDGVRFTLSDERRAELRVTALERAMDTARTDADGIASAADLSVTGVRQTSTGAEFTPFPVARFEDAAEGGGTVIQPAPVTVTVTVDVTYTAA
ncbi:SIMPL domain-containing protein [Haloplanus natans]|uniref:SIMPL domain-containing protein n=1 Tax=Haloplanus natans TaxID=376171 RepID=UPI0006777B13|nr:SIMPL domain-containing protein [Haloplanus natans]